MQTVTIETTIQKNIEQVWDCWVNPEHITKWNFAIDTWHCPSASNDFRVGGKMSSRMEAKDGSMGFDFWGIYTNILPYKIIELTLGDERKVKTSFEEIQEGVKIIESFETEDVNSIEMQKAGWQSILDNFKLYTESF